MNAYIPIIVMLVLAAAFVLVTIGLNIVVNPKRANRTNRPSAQAIQAGVHDDAMQPGRHRRVAAELVGATKGRDQGVLQGVGGVLGIGGRAHGDGPESIAVSRDDHAERVRIPGHVRGEQLGIAALVVHGRHPSHRRAPRPARRRGLTRER